MMQVKWTRRAERSLGLIAEHIARDNPGAAYGFVMKMREAVSRLADNPRMGRSGRVTGTRELVVAPNYILPYRIVDNEIHVLHVFHVKRRWPDNF